MQKIVVTSLLVLCSMSSIAWNSISELEASAISALEEPSSLLAANFTNSVRAALLSTNRMMKTDAEILQAIISYQRFLGTADGRMVDDEVQCLSNVVELTCVETNTWQYWMGRLLLTSTFAADSNFAKSYQMSTNYIQMLNDHGGVMETNALNSAILAYYEMPGIEVDMAFKVFAGMSAAGYGMGNVATNYANQVPTPYRNIILEFVK